MLSFKGSVLNIIKNFNKKFLLLLFLVLVIGGFFRLYKLGNQSYIGDEYYGLNASYGYAQSGEWKDWDFNKNELTSRVYKRSQIYYWQVAQVFKVLDPIEANSRLISVFWGMLSIISVFIITFLLTRNYYIAILSSFLIAISISSLIYDRKLRMYSMFVPVYFWFSYSLFRFIESAPKRGITFVNKISIKSGLNWNFLPAVIVFGLISFCTHLLAVNIIPAFLVYLMVMAIFVFVKKKEILNKYLILLILGVLFIFIGMETRRFQDALSFFSWRIDNWGYFKIVTLDYSNMLLAIVFFLIGSYYLIKNHFKAGVWIVVSYIVVLFLAIMIWRREPGNQYIVFTQPFKIIIISSGIFYVAKIIADKVFDSSRKHFWGLIALFLILIFNFSFFYSKDSFYGNVKSWNYSNYREVSQYFLNHRDYKSVLIIRNIPSKDYYFNGFYVDLINYNEKEGYELTLNMVLDAQKEYKDVWLIFSRSFYIDGDALDYIEEKFEEVDSSYANKQLEIWRWRNSDINNKK